MTSSFSVVLRVRDPSEALKFFRDVLGYPGESESLLAASVELPGCRLALVRDDDLDALHGAGARRNRVGVGVEFKIVVDDPREVAERIRSRGGFLVEATEGRTVARDMDGYVWTFTAAPRTV
ncbi:MAG: hypothetical protein RIS21_1013 [Planctomycetota bacterium]